MRIHTPRKNLGLGISALPHHVYLLNCSASKENVGRNWLVFVHFLPFDLIKADVTQTKTFPLKQHYAGEHVCICLMIMMS